MKKSEQLQIIYQDIEQKRARHIMILKKIQDQELRLLKGHLLIEEVLYELIQEKMKNPSVLENARFTFAQLLSLVEGLYYEKEIYTPWLYAATNKLNKLRNKLAHNTEPDALHKEIEVFCTYVLTNNRHDEKPIDDTLLYALGSIYGTFAAILGLEKKLSLLPSALQAFTFESKLIASKMIHSGDLDEI